jgi:hypothetical protein
MITQAMVTYFVNDCSCTLFSFCVLDDLVTAVEFDINGNYLAVGDKAGRICVFEAQVDLRLVMFYFEQGVLMLE